MKAQLMKKTVFLCMAFLAYTHTSTTNITHIMPYILPHLTTKERLAFKRFMRLSKNAMVTVHSTPFYDNVYVRVQPNNSHLPLLQKCITKQQILEFIEKAASTNSQKVDPMEKLLLNISTSYFLTGLRHTLTTAPLRCSYDERDPNNINMRLQHTDYFIEYNTTPTHSSMRCVYKKVDGTLQFMHTVTKKKPNPQE